MKNYVPFEEDWHHSPKKTRGVKFLGSDKPEDVERVKEFIEKARRASNCLLQKLHRHVLDKIQVVNAKGELELKYDPAKLSRAKHGNLLEQDETPFLCEEFGYELQRMRRSCAYFAVQVLKSYIKRHSDQKKIVVPESCPRLKNTHSMFLTEGPATDRNKKASEGFLRVKSGDKDYFDLPYFIPKGMFKNKKYLKSQFGGNLYVSGSRWVYAACYNIPFKWAYDPVAAIGVDMNLAIQHFLTFSDGWVIRSSERLQKYVMKLQDLNEELHDSERVAKSSQRRAVRMKIKRTHKRLEEICLPICEEILDKVVANQLLLCIDDLSCGAKTGSFGHDKVIKILRYLCEEKGIPFVMVPTYHTSIVHHKCQEMAFREEGFGRCPCTPQSYNIHDNASKNIADWGWHIWRLGMKDFSGYCKPYREEGKRRRDAQKKLKKIAA